MQEQEKLREIQSLGQEAPGAGDAPKRNREKGSWLLLLQCLVCGAILALLLGLRAWEPELFRQAAQWYHAQMEREMQLPGWAGEEETSSAPGLFLV